MSLLCAVEAAGFSLSGEACDFLAHWFGNAADRPERHRAHDSDLTDAEWREIQPLLPVPAWLEGRGGRPEGYCHRVMLDAVFYVVDNGIKWRNMPVDFPAWDRGYAFWRRRRKNGLIDSQSVKADTVVGADSRGYDGAKKINGRRRHLICDTIGLLLAIRVLPADVTDRQAATDILPALRTRFPTITKLCADSGYTGVLVTWALAVLQLVVTHVKRCDDLRGFRVLPRRWVVERSFGRLLRTRRLARDFERRCDSSEAMILWSMTMLMTRRLAHRP